jgi:hypothetical protein
MASTRANQPFANAIVVVVVGDGVVAGPEDVETPGAADVVVVAGPDTGRQLWLDSSVCDLSGATPTTEKQ